MEPDDCDGRRCGRGRRRGAVLLVVLLGMVVAAAVLLVLKVRAARHRPPAICARSADARALLNITMSPVQPWSSGSSPPLASAGLQARDGFGDAVEWFFVIKLPLRTFPEEQVALLSSLGDAAASLLNASSVHCSCPDPVCDTSSSPGNGAGRGAGLCYLYADSAQPTLRWFSDVKDEQGNAMECLGQGGRDPLSQAPPPNPRSQCTSRSGSGSSSSSSSSSQQPAASSQQQQQHRHHHRRRRRHHHHHHHHNHHHHV
jgi:hypothetical protein